MNNSVVQNKVRYRRNCYRVDLIFIKARHALPLLLRKEMKRFNCFVIGFVKVNINKFPCDGQKNIINVPCIDFISCFWALLLYSLIVWNYLLAYLLKKSVLGLLSLNLRDLYFYEPILIIWSYHIKRGAKIDAPYKLMCMITWYLFDNSTCCQLIIAILTFSRYWISTWVGPLIYSEIQHLFTEYIVN